MTACVLTVTLERKTILVTATHLTYMVQDFKQTNDSLSQPIVKYQHTAQLDAILAQAVSVPETIQDACIIAGHQPMSVEITEKGTV
jgi:hypothetical protein